MATIRKRGDKYQVQVRRKGHPPLSRSFIQRKDALEWARMMEVKVDRRELPNDPKILSQTTLGSAIGEAGEHPLEWIGDVLSVLLSDAPEVEGLDTLASITSKLPIASDLLLKEFQLLGLFHPAALCL